MVISTGPAKQMQHFNATYSNIVAHKMLHTFGHPFATCCNMLGDVESSLTMVNFFLASSCNMFGCCMMR